MAAFWTRLLRVKLIYLFILLGIATNGYSQNSTNCKRAGWEIFGDQQASDDVCEIAQDLMDHCEPERGAQVAIKPRSETSPWYKASDIPLFPDCACTRLMYNVLSVCAACQMFNVTHHPTGGFPSVSDYAGSSCQDFHGTNGTLQLLPTDDHGKDWLTIAPQWSLDLNDETFNLQKAQNFLSQSSSPNTTTPTGEATPTEAQTTTASADVNSRNSASSSGPNIGAIAGGVVGGLAFLGAILALLFFLRHRKRRTRDVAPSDEFLKPEYYATPPLLSASNERRDSAYRDDGGEEEEVMPAIPHRLSWAGGLVATRRTEDEEGDMLPPFTQGTYIGPSPHEKGVPARRRTDESDGTMRTSTTNTNLISPTGPGTSEHV